MDTSPCCGCQNQRHQWTFLGLGLVVFAALGAGSEAVAVDKKFRCGPGISTPGVTVPSGDIFLEDGSSLEILCILSPSVLDEGLNSSNLSFYHTSYRVLPEFITIVNETTVRLYIEKPVPMKDMYYCKLQNGTQETTVCLNSVSVGFKPKPVNNFSCISYNWNNLNCTWVPPVNYVKTDYTLVYYLPGRAGGRLKYHCPNETDIQGKNYCYWDQSTATPYRQPYPKYHFIMTGKNIFGNITTNTVFHHYAHVVPAKPANLVVLERTHSSALIQWSLVFPLQNFPPGVVQRVEYQSAWDATDKWFTANTSSLNIKNATHQLNVTGLGFPNTLYDFRVFMRSAHAISEDMWSQPATLTIKLKSAVPGEAPKTDIGSFEIPNTRLTSRDVYVYWRRIPDYKKNGDPFSYLVTVEEDGIPRNFRADTSDPYTLFTGLSLNSYRFKIYSVNPMGQSKDYSEVYIPPQHNSIPEPLSVTKIAFDKRIYELSWKPANTKRPIDSYTIFWCDNKQDRPYQCTGTLNWTRVPRDVVIKNITVPDEKVYQFAISANTNMESSGMVWASCTVIHDKIFGKMKNVWINRIGSTFIEVGWKLECSDRIGVVTGFIISYCPIVAPHDLVCKVTEKNTTIKGDSMTIRGNVTGLTPYTTYMVKVAVLTRNNKEGQWSESQFNTTLEAAPDTPPVNVTVSDVTNTSVVVRWIRPASMNGLLRYYQVHYGADKVTKVEGNQPDTWVTLNKLSSFTEYNVSVSACTVTCSARSPPVSVRTAIGRPGMMDQPIVKFFNFSLVEVTWKPPAYAGGPLNAYQVKMDDVSVKRNLTDIQNCTGNLTLISTVDCKSLGPNHVYSFSVRAVNYVNDTPFYGPWSNPVSGPCFTPGLADHLWIIFWIVAFFAFFAILFGVVIFGKRLYDKYLEINDLGVKLPPGLDPVGIDKPNDPDYHSHLNLYGWGPPPLDDQKTEASAPDQQLLLQKKRGSEGEREAEMDADGELEGEGEGDADVGNYSSLGDGDSSGCSSGHESVASSLTAGTHISHTSDSGTEADQLNQRALSLDGVFSEMATPSLRLRNKAAAEAAASTDSSSSGSGRWKHTSQPYVMLGGTSCLVKSTPNLSEASDGGGTSGYSLLGGLGAAAGGAAAWKPTPSASGYVTLPPANPMPPPYVAHSALKVLEPAALPPVPVSGKGYVMAGECETPPPAQYCRLGHSDYVPHS